MSVAANQLVQDQDAGALVGIPVGASTHIYGGTLVFRERTSGAGEGYATDTPDTNANDFAGVARDEADNSAGSAGDKDVECYQEGSFVLQGSGFSQANNGDVAYASDNYTVTTNNAYAAIGRIVEVLSATKVRVKIDVVQTP